MAQLTRRAAISWLASALPAFAQTDPLAGRFGGPFMLVNGDGKTVKNTDFLGRFMLVYFGYTHCPDVCPDDLLIMADALRFLGVDAARVQPLFITIDPQRDTPQVMKEYAESFSPDIIGLSGTEVDIAALARAYRVHRRKLPSAAGESDQNNYLVDHSSLTYLMGPDGMFRTLIPHKTSAMRMVEIIRKYMAQ